VATLASSPSRTELVPIAVLLSNDDDAEVRAHAARALASHLGDAVVADLAAERLNELLRGDGILAPLHALSALRNASFRIPGNLRDLVADLADNYPARGVRRAAHRVLESEGTAPPIN
jgi:hypothetical protein